MSQLIEPQNYLNREMSWLEFNQRVLDQAADEHVKILERCKFLAITCSNLDEFFMVRVGGLELQAEAGTGSSDPAGLTVDEQIVAIRERSLEMVNQQYHLFHSELTPRLEQHGVQRVHLDNCSLKHSQAARRVFDEEIVAVLSPIGISDETQFPLLASRPLHVAVQIRNPEAEETPFRFAVIPLGTNLPRVLTLPAESGFSFALLEDTVRAHVQDFFPGEDIVASTVFRITRNADISLQEDSAPDLIHGMKEILLRRKLSPCVRLEILDDVTDELLEFLQSKLGIEDRHLIRCPGPLDLTYLMRVASLKGFEHLRDESWPSQRSPLLDPTESMFQTIAERDVLLSHPYEGYSPVVRLINEAADDPDVLAIKQTLYRTSRDSSIVAALRRAAEKGKYVTTIVELKARFDEARNIEWAEELEQAGVQMIYGVRNLKTHAKICVIVRREPRGIVRYIHFGTGNYNESTAALYGDISYMTCNDQLGQDASAFFNAITGYSQPKAYNLLEAAPLGLRKKVLTLIEGEIERRKQGQRAHIMVKLNALVDPELIAALYRASQAGVQVQLNIRGICCLRPGVPGLSENISVISIVDRFLEHARIMYFHHGGDNLAFISSADWMPRNLDKRVELLVPVVDRKCKQLLIRTLETYFKDTVSSWQLESDGEYRRRSGDDHFRSQEVLYKNAVEAIRLEEQKRNSVFEPHQPSKQVQE
ncbi:MAG: polyphosphate kinase 1 [Aureliella sp.]